MGLWGTPDFLAVSCCGAQTLGVRMRRRNGVCTIIRSAVSDHPTREAAVREVLDELGGTPGAWVLLGVDLEGTERAESMLHYVEIEIDN